MNALPEAFKKNILSLFPEEAGYFFEALSHPPQTSVRLNPTKPSTAFEKETQVPWCKNGRNLAARPGFTEDPLFHAGAYYVQESSSMFLYECIRQLTFEQAPLVLDLCAAPGGKSTILLDALPDNALLVSNEVIKTRVSVLQENLVKWGHPNVLITQNDPRHFQKTQVLFDLILVDAPCSGEGLWRRDAKAMEEWSPEHIELCYARQDRILDEILPCLKPGGFLIYSTCTFNEKENEIQIENLIQKQGLKAFPIHTETSWNLIAKDDFQFRFLPHRVKGEGLFLAVLQKPSAILDQNVHGKKVAMQFVPKKILPEIYTYLAQPEYFDYFFENDFIYAFPKAWMQTYEALRSQLYIRFAGICMGKMDKNGKLIPEHSLALSTAIHPDVPGINLNHNDAILYLKRENIRMEASVATGWTLACYHGLPLGWMKVLPNRVNNYFPGEYRILKDIPKSETC